MGAQVGSQSLFSGAMRGVGVMPHEGSKHSAELSMCPSADHGSVQMSTRSSSVWTDLGQRVV